MTVFSNSMAIKSHILLTGKSLRTYFIGFTVAVLLLLSYFEIFLILGHSDLDMEINPHSKRDLFNNLPNVTYVTQTSTYPKKHYPKSFRDIKGLEVISTFTKATNKNQWQIKSNRKVLNCGDDGSFLSIRWTENWEQGLSNRYSEILQGLKGGNDLVQERPGIPIWQIELQKQKYIVAAAFQPIISEMEFTILLRTFYTLAEALVKANVTFFLYGGSHLGVYRHHGIVPWDDDIDIMVNASERGKAMAVLNDIPFYSLYSPLGRQWKFYESSLAAIFNKPYRWPFIDIFFFRENSTHIWDELPSYQGEFTYRKCDVFPLVFRPFEGGMVPVPCNSLDTLQNSYSINICKSNTYWHKFESYASRSRKKNIRCSVLHDIFPFVKRSTNKTSNCRTEKRKVGNSTLSIFVYKAQCKCPI